jgi:hypothetical protein
VKNVLILGVLVLVTVIVTRNISRGEFDFNVDESQHAATGLYVASLIRDRPSHPVAYTYRYYAQYPALSGIIHWPPVFYVCEGAMFLISPTVVTARLTVLFFALLGCIFFFFLVSELTNDWTAACAALLVALLPSVLLFEKTVMLEIPCLALCLAALYYWHRYLTAERLRDLYWFSLWCGAALLTKQNSIFVPLTCVLTLTLLHKWPLVLDRRVLGPLALAFGLIAPFYTVVYLVHWKSVAVDLGGRAGPVASAGLTHSLRIVTFYAKVLPGQFGWPLLVIAVIGVATWRFWSKREHMVFFMAWIAACYIVFTLISRKDPRHVLYWVPPFAFFIVGPLTVKWKPIALQAIAKSLAIGLLLHAGVVGWNFQRPYIEGYEATVNGLIRLNDPGVILFEAPLPANFIFFLRRVDFERRFLVLRKSLRVMRIMASSGFEDLATTVEQVRDVVDRNGVKYVVVSDGPALFDGQRSLRFLLQSEPQFKLRGTFPISGNEPDQQDQHLYVYENTQCVLPMAGSLRIRMLTTGNDVIVPWNELLRSR